MKKAELPINAAIILIALVGLVVVSIILIIQFTGKGENFIDKLDNFWKFFT
ncbi:MAG: hypothetical protein Q7R96_03380 [Nanoarchaeota archaeon]|nr:hypothetical protein [Nanoarchaeota archaeon]